MMPQDRSGFRLGIGTVVVIILALVGGAVTLTDPAALSFTHYYEFLVASGAITAVGHGLDNGTGSAP